MASSRLETQVMPAYVLPQESEAAWWNVMFLETLEQANGESSEEMLKLSRAETFLRGYSTKQKQQVWPSALGLKDHKLFDFLGVMAPIRALKRKRGWGKKDQSKIEC